MAKRLLTGQLAGQVVVGDEIETHEIETQLGAYKIAMSVGMGLWGNPMLGCGQRIPSSGPSQPACTTCQPVDKSWAGQFPSTALAPKRTGALLGAGQSSGSAAKKKVGQADGGADGPSGTFCVAVEVWNMTVVQRWGEIMTVGVGLARDGRIDVMVLSLCWLSIVCCCRGPWRFSVDGDTKAQGRRRVEEPRGWPHGDLPILSLEGWEWCRNPMPCRTEMADCCCPRPGETETAAGQR